MICSNRLLVLPSWGFVGTALEALEDILMSLLEAQVGDVRSLFIRGNMGWCCGIETRESVAKKPDVSL